MRASLPNRCRALRKKRDEEARSMDGAAGDLDEGTSLGDIAESSAHA